MAQVWVRPVSAQPTPRGDTGCRIYDARAGADLTFIIKAQALGYTLRQLKPAIKRLQLGPD